ncbi:MAG: acyl-CoA dehydrogenase family protein [Chloroflexi bacterium]|nr:acyl-CoA dehydrogenase family protein [Chloroflexota bacterium]
MYDFSPSAEQTRVVERVRVLMEELVYPNEGRTEPHRGLPRELLRELQARVKAEGLWAAHLPRQAGGLGMGNVTLGLINEQLGRSPIAPRVFGTSAPDTGNTEILWMAGTPEQKRKYLEPLVADDVRSCIAMTEPEVSGSDPTTLRTTATWEGSAWVINGHKWFITGASGAAFAIVFAVTDPEAPPHRRASMFLVDTDTPGYELVREVPVMGDQSLGGHCELRFVDCRVAPENMLGERGGGFALAQARLGPGRITHCMRWIGVAQRAFELMLARALERETRGQKLAELQTIQNWIADSAAELHGFRLMTLHAAWKMDQELDARTEISMIKFIGARVLHDVLDRSIQVHGALGFSSDSPLEGWYREARAARIYDGPDEVHRMVVARQMLRAFQRSALSVSAGAASEVAVPAAAHG